MILLFWYTNAHLKIGIHPHMKKYAKGFTLQLFFIFEIYLILVSKIFVYKLSLIFRVLLLTEHEHSREIFTFVLVCFYGNLDLTVTVEFWKINKNLFYQVVILYFCIEGLFNRKI